MSKFTDERVSAALRGTRNFRVIDWPGPGKVETKVAVRLLSELELDEARLEAQMALRGNAKARGWDAESMASIEPELLQRLIERQIIWLAFYDADTVDRAGRTPERFFPTPRDVGTLDSVTVTRLFTAYCEHQTWCAPFRSMSDEEVTSFVEALGKGQTAQALLEGYERSTLARLCISMASRLLAT